MKGCELKVVFTAMDVSYLGVKNNKKTKRKKKSHGCCRRVAPGYWERLQLPWYGYCDQLLNE
jgi:hypothetical protein